MSNVTISKHNRNNAKTNDVVSNYFFPDVNIKNREWYAILAADINRTKIDENKSIDDTNNNK